jgi:hypothetical protein
VSRRRVRARRQPQATVSPDGCKAVTLTNLQQKGQRGFAPPFPLLPSF